MLFAVELREGEDASGFNFNCLSQQDLLEVMSFHRTLVSSSIFCPKSCINLVAIYWAF